MGRGIDFTEVILLLGLCMVALGLIGKFIFLLVFILKGA